MTFTLIHSQVNSWNGSNGINLYDKTCVTKLTKTELNEAIQGGVNEDWNLNKNPVQIGTIIGVSDIHAFKKCLLTSSTSSSSTFGCEATWAADTVFSCQTPACKNKKDRKLELRYSLIITLCLSDNSSVDLFCWSKNIEAHADRSVVHYPLTEKPEDYIKRQFENLTKMGPVEVEYYSKNDKNTGTERLILHSLKKAIMVDEDAGAEKSGTEVDQSG